MTFEQTIAELKSPDADTRLRAVQMLKDAAYPEAAVPLAAVLTDPDDDVQTRGHCGRAEHLSGREDRVEASASG